jgi:hypothetical protein
MLWEVTNERVFSGSSNISWKCSQYSSQRFEHALFMVPKVLTPEHKEKQVTLAGDLITKADQDVDF